MKYRLIAVDLDDSLLDHHQRISERNKQALRAAQEMGTHVTVATGRIPDSAMPFIRELNVTVPIIAYQGAYIKDTMTGETLVKNPIPMEYAYRIFIHRSMWRTTISLNRSARTASSING